MKNEEPPIKDDKVYTEDATTVSDISDNETLPADNDNENVDSMMSDIISEDGGDVRIPTTSPGLNMRILSQRNLHIITEILNNLVECGDLILKNGLNGDNELVHEMERG